MTAFSLPGARSASDLAKMLLLTGALALGNAALAGPAPGNTAPADDVPTDDPEIVVLTWHKISGTPFDFERAVNFSPKVAGPPTFDRPDIIRAELARLRGIHDSGSPQRIFTATVNDTIQQYDHDRGEFPIGLFQPGIYLQFPYHYVDYRLVFANAGMARAIRMPKEEARLFDQKLQAGGRGVSTVVRFRLIGSGDPQGAVDGQRVMRGELVSVQLLDRDGRVVYAPQIRSVADMPPPPKFAAAEIDVAGMRIGVEAGDLQAALERLYSGKVDRVEGARDRMIDTRYAGYLEIDLLQCMGGGYRRRDPQPGEVCLRAYYDEDEVIRTLIVVRVLPWMDAENIREAALARYGEVSAGGGLLLGWGPAVDPKLLSYRVADGRALTMNVSSPSDFMDQALNSRPKVNFALQLIDPEWAAKARPLR